MTGWGVAEAEHADALLAWIDAALDGLTALPWQRLAEDDLVAATRRVERIARRLLGPQIVLAAELTERGVPDRHGCASTARYLSDLLKITTSAAAGRVQAAKQILPRDTDTGGELPPLLPAVAAAVGRGQVGADQLRIITRTMNALPATVDDHSRAWVEQTLLAEAAHRPATQLHAAAEQLLAQIIPADNSQDLDAADRAAFTIGTARGDGLTPIHGLLDKLAVEHLRQALEPLAAPKPADDGHPDPRPAATRRAHALTELARRWLGVGNSPTSRGVRPHATIIATLDQLRGGAGAALLDYAGPAGTHLTRLLTCDADIALHIVDQHGRHIDGTGTFRLFNPAQRRALAVRDQGCAWPGCDVPAAWTDAHHIRHWANGGPTTLDNAVLLCGHHHGYIHRAHCEWEIRLNPTDRKPDFHPPSWMDPDRTPRRNHLHNRADLTIHIPAPAVART